MWFGAWAGVAAQERAGRVRTSIPLLLVLLQMDPSLFSTRWQCVITLTDRGGARCCQQLALPLGAPPGGAAPAAAAAVGVAAAPALPAAARLVLAKAPLRLPPLLATRLFKGILAFRPPTPPRAPTLHSTY